MAVKRYLLLYFYKWNAYCKFYLKNIDYENSHSINDEFVGSRGFCTN